MPNIDLFALMERVSAKFLLKSALCRHGYELFLWWIIHYSKQIVASAKLISLPNSTRQTYVGQPTNQHQRFQLFKHRTGLKYQRQSTPSKRDSNLPVFILVSTPESATFSHLKLKVLFYNCQISPGGAFPGSNSNFFWTVYALGQIRRFWPEIFTASSGTLFHKGDQHPHSSQDEIPCFPWVFPVLHKFSLCYFYTKTNN